MAFRPNKPTSDFTKRALKKNVGGIEQYSGFSDSYLYGILSGVHPDHLDYARDIHRALCVVDAPAAREYRSLLEADGLVKSAGVDESPDDLAIKRLCDDLTTALQLKHRGEATGSDVRSAALKLRAVLGCLIGSDRDDDEIQGQSSRRRTLHSGEGEILN